MTELNSPDLHEHLKNQASTEGKIAVISDSPAYTNDLIISQPLLPFINARETNQPPDAKAAEIFMSVLDVEQVAAIHLYLEVIQDAPELSQAALRAVRKGIPVVVLRGGRFAAGNRVTQKSSKSTIEDEGILAALFERFGFIQCATLEETVETLKMLLYGGRPLGYQLAISTSSNASAVLAADTAQMVGLQVPELEESISSFLSPLLQDNNFPKNPLYAVKKESLSQIYRSFLAGNFHVGVQVKNPASDWSDITPAFAQEAAKQNMPCAFISSTADPIPKSVFEMLIANGAAPLSGLKAGLQAIANTVNFVEQMVLMAQMPTGAITLPTVASLSQTTQLDEVEGKRLLYQAGIKVPKAAIIEGSNVIGLNELSFPVVLKAVGASLTHKTELGAVKLSIESDEALRQTLFDMNDWLDSVDLRGFLIEEMITDGIGELLVGVRHVAEVGQVLTLAFGGVTVELLGDAKTLLLPASSSEIEQALRSLRLFPTINGWRNKPAADIDQVVETISLICYYAQSQVDRLFALEVNPLIVRPAPHTPVAADAVFQFGDKVEN